MSTEYGGDGPGSDISPGQGQVGIAEGVRRALEDERNAGAYLFVQIDIFPPERYMNAFDDYICNGRSIAEWRELIDLANGTYPYDEYNGDHGGNVTEARKAAQQAAQALDAQANYDAALAQYSAVIAPMLAEAKARREQNECERLQGLGYDVFFMDTWTYSGAAEKTPQRILAGLLSAQQLGHFAADAQCGYFIDWVYCGDGILNWDAGLRP